MVRISIGNSACKLHSTPPEVIAYLRKNVMVRKATGKMAWTVVHGQKRRVPEMKKIMLVSKEGSFPTGLLYLVERLLKKKGVSFKIQDTRRVPNLGTEPSLIWRNREFQPYPEQEEAAACALARGRGIIVGPTGVGKSAICLLTVEAFQVRTLILVPKKGLREQMIRTLNQAFGRGVAGRLHKQKAVFPITVENVDAVKPAADLTGVDLLIVDEFHHSAADTYRRLNRVAFKNIYWKIGLTATPFRNNSNERLLLESVLSETIYRIPYETAVAKKYIVPMKVFYVDAPAPKTKRKQTFTKYAKAYEKLIVENEQAAELVASVARKTVAAGHSTLVLCRQIEHGNLIQSKLEDLGLAVPFAEGKSEVRFENIDSFNRQEELCLIGTTGVLGEGVDTKPAEFVILAGAGKSKNEFMQNLGRGFRTFPGKAICTIVIIRYPGCLWFERHFDACCEYLDEEYGATPQPLSMD